MASTNKTPQLGLNQWAAGDSVLREDFNGDNLKIDGAVEALQLPNPVIGHYIGDGTTGRKISLGFQPSFIIMLCSWLGSATPTVSFLTYDRVTLVNDNTCRHNARGSGGIWITGDGFEMERFNDYNTPDTDQYYIAFR